ncbi:MAG: BPL-N domain-containing protein [Pirellulales bacterium]
MLFCGTGTSLNDVKAIEAILRSRGIEYETADSEQLAEMSEPALQTYRLLIFPGGNYIEMGKGLSAETTAKIRQVVEGGVNYLGICGGALLAGDGDHNNLNLTSGVRFDFYSAVNDGVHKQAVAITAAEGPAIEHYWEDGPQLSGWGAAVAKYPDGTPAVAQGRCGKGWMILCGTHPEAPENWREGMAFTMPATESNAYAGMLIEAALNGRQLPQF